MNKGLYGFPRSGLQSQRGLYGYPRGDSIDVIRSSRSALIQMCLNDGPLGIWTCQESSGYPQDYSGRSLHMQSQTGAADYRVAGPYGDDYGIRIDGTFMVPSVVMYEQDNFTLEVIWKIENCDTTDEANSFAQGYTGSANWSLFPRADGKFQVLFGNVVYMGVSNGTIEGIGWCHVVVVRRSGTLEYYLNGSQDTGNAGTNSPIAAEQGFRIGSSAGTNAFVYALAAVYNQPLSAARILEHFKQSGC